LIDCKNKVLRIKKALPVKERLYKLFKILLFS